MEPDQRVVEIRDSEIDVAAIMARVRERIRQRRAQADAQGLEYDRLVDGRAPRIAADLSEVDLEYDLRQAQIGAEAVLVSLEMRDRHIPVFNSFFYRLEELLHRLALKYVNRMAGRQVVFNTAAANVIATVARRLEQHEAQTQKLEQEVRALRERVAKLEGTRGAS